MDNIELRRRSLMQNIIIPDTKIWLIKNGIEQVQNTGGYVPTADVVDGVNMSGWTRKAPTINLFNGYLQLYIAGNPVVGSLVPQKYFTYDEVKGKYINVDCEIVLAGAGAHFSAIAYSPSTLRFDKVLKTASASRETYSVQIRTTASERPDLNVGLEVCTRSVSYVNIYNLWIE